MISSRPVPSATTWTEPRSRSAPQSGPRGAPVSTTHPAGTSTTNCTALLMRATRSRSLINSATSIFGPAGDDASRSGGSTSSPFGQGCSVQAKPLLVSAAAMTSATRGWSDAIATQPRHAGSMRVPWRAAEEQLAQGEHLP